MACPRVPRGRTPGTRRLKARRQETGVLAFERLGELVPATVAAEAMRIVLAMHFFNLVGVERPGARGAAVPLGRRLLSCHPAIPIARGQGLAVGLLSYAGRVDVGLLGGGDLARDLAAIARAMPETLAELLRAARATGASVARPATPRPPVPARPADGAASVAP